MNTRISSRDVPIRWIGLAEVKPLDGNLLLGESKGAFVPVVGDAANSASFVILVREDLKSSGFQLVNLEDIEPLETRLLKHSLPQELDSALEKISEENRVVYGSFHSFDD